MVSVMILEDETAIRELLSFICEKEGWRTIKAGSLQEADQTIKKIKPDLILLDVMLPDGSGFDWLIRLKREESTREIPVIMLTARGDEIDRVQGLESGADDYVVKPFLPRELIARIRVVLRRNHAPSTVDTITDDHADRLNRGPLMLDESRFEASVEGEVLKLSVKEFRLLYLFAKHPGRVLSRAQVLNAIWGNQIVDLRTVDVHMLRLRKALSGTAAENMLETVRGVGYRFRFDEE